MNTVTTLTKGRGLEIDLNWELATSIKLQSYLNNNLKNFDQEIEPYVISEIAKQTIRDLLFDSGIDLNKIENFSEQSEYDWILFKNCFDTKNIPLTPVDDCPPENSSWKTPAAVLMGLLSLSGHKVASYKGEMNGRLAHMVMPAKNSEKYKARSTKQLMPHTEVVNGLWPEEIDKNVNRSCIAPNVFGLASIRNPSNCATRIWYLNDILQILSYSTIRDLMRNEYRATSQSSFDTQNNIENVSVISELNGSLSIRFSYSKLIGTTLRAKIALNKVKEYLDEESTVQRIVIKPGQVLILNNRTLLHGRDNLQHHAQYDGNDRWLLRMYGFSYDGWRKLPKNEILQHVAAV